MWYMKMLVTFVVGITEIGCKLCPETESVQVIPVCTTGTVQGGAVAISTKDLPDLPELYCSCTISVFLVGNEPVPVLYYYGPEYSPCGIDFDIGGYTFSCFQGFVHFNQTVTDIYFTKDLPSSYPEACLLFLSDGPNTELKISCRQPNVIDTPTTASVSATKLVTTKPSTITSGTSPPFNSSLVTIVSEISTGDKTNNLTTISHFSLTSTKRTIFLSSKPTSTFTDRVTTSEKPNITETSLTTDKLNTSFVTDVTVTQRSSDVTKTSSKESSSVTNVTDINKSPNTMGTSAVTDVLETSFSPTVPDTSKTSPKPTLLWTDTTVTSVHTKVSNKQRSMSTLVSTMTSPNTVSVSSFTSLSVSFTTPRQNSSSSQTSGATWLSLTSHFSSRLSASATTDRSSFPVLANFTSNGPDSTTIGALFGKSQDEDDHTYLIVIAGCCGVLIALLIAVSAFLYIFRRKTRNRKKSIPRREQTATTYTYIDAFKGDNIILLNEPIYFTATPVGIDSHISPRNETSPVAFNSATTPCADTIVTPTQTDIYAIVTKRSPEFLTQPMKKMVSFKGAGTGSDLGKDSTPGEQRKPVSQFGILQRRESAKLERKVSQIRRDIEASRDARSQYDHFSVDMHAF